MYFFMYYITIKVALPVSGLRIIRIFNYTYYNSILCLYILIPRGSVYTMGDRFV